MGAFVTDRCKTSDSGRDAGFGQRFYKENSPSIGLLGALHGGFATVCDQHAYGWIGRSPRIGTGDDFWTSVLTIARGAAYEARITTTPDVEGYGMRCPNSQITGGGTFLKTGTGKRGSNSTLFGRVRATAP